MSTLRVVLAGALEDVSFGTGSPSLRALADRIGARRVASAIMPATINTSRDLVRQERHHGL